MKTKSKQNCVVIITATSQWARMKSPASRLFAQPFVQSQINENFKAPRHWPLWANPPVTGGFPSKGSVTRKMFPFDDVIIFKGYPVFVRRAGLLWSHQDFEWRWSVPLFKCLTVLEFSFILFDLCLLITFFNFIMNYVPIVTFWIFTYHKIRILSIMFFFIWSYWIIYFLACLEVSWRVVS